jgi:hypothetical protein
LAVPGYFTVQPEKRRTHASRTIFFIQYSLKVKDDDTYKAHHDHADYLRFLGNDSAKAVYNIIIILEA